MNTQLELRLMAERLPEAIVVGTQPSNRRPRLVATGYNAPLDKAFSGSSFYLASSGMQAGVLDGCFTLQSPTSPDFALNLRGALWKLSRAATGRRRGGFKFTSEFNDHIWRRFGKYVHNCDVINNSQIYGRAFDRIRKKNGLRRFNYIDGTLNEYFTTYSSFDVVSIIDQSTRDAAVEIEREGYADADHIFTMSARTAADLVDHYGVDRQRISVVSPGANIPDDLAEASMREDHDRGAFVLGFVGLYPLRKGLDRLAAAMSILRGRGHNVRLRVIGRCPDEIARMDGVEFVGQIDKATQMAEFLAAIADVDLGCQLSRAELVGIAPLEFSRVGVPFLATEVGGVPELVAGAGGILVKPDIEVEELAEVIGELVVDRERYQALRRETKARRAWSSWQRAAGELDTVLSG